MPRLSQAPHNSRPANRSKPGSGPANRLAVLFIGTEHTEMLWLHWMLSKTADFKLYWCNSPAIVMEVLERRHYDLVIWEEHLFEEEQGSFLRILIQHAHAPVVVLGSQRSEKQIRRLILNGAADYIGKYEMSASLLIRILRRARYRALSVRYHHLPEQMDSLTGVLDRSFFRDRLNQLLTRARRAQKPVGLIFLNIDKFRSVNQSLGYHIGDMLIKMVVSRLRRGLRRPHSLARVGGDEFAIILEGIGDSPSLGQIADKLQQAFTEPYQFKQRSIELTVSMGIASYPDGGRTADILLQHANQAMFDAKKKAGNSYQFFDLRRNEELRHQLALETDLRQTIRGSRLEVYYQPKIDVKTGAVIGMEALVRWPHPRHGMLAPQSFIPMAERSALVVPMGYYVLKKTCDDIAFLQNKGYSNLHCSVNLSFRQFHDRRLAETVFRIIYAANIDTTGFEFELTESAMMYDQVYTLKCLKELTHLGLNFALDDFGTGYSSFSNLRNLPISSVKIDKSFVERLEDSSEDQTLVAGMISLAHNLKMEVVAEGVETPGQLAFLRRHQCDYAQGFLIAEPMPFKDFCQFIDRSTQRFAKSHSDL